MSTPISGSRVALDFEGRKIDARVGESVMASLVASGVLSFRTTRSGAARGPFCGMGVCQDCLVEIDGLANRRACMATVEGPMSVRREIFGRPLPDLAGEKVPPSAGPIAVERPELLVIGGGPAGLAAAIAARRAGVQVLLVDERASLGGQYFKQLAVTGADIADADAQHREGTALIAEARRAGVEIRTRTEVWGAFPPGEFAAKSGGRSMRLLPAATILANGAYERGWPVPGWTLPGVMTTGAAQTLWRSARRLPGQRVLIAGNGPLNLQLAAELVGGGAEIVAILEAAARPSVNRIPELLTMLATSPALVRDGLIYHARRRAGNVPMVHGCTVAGIEQNEEDGLIVHTQHVDSAGPGRSFAADIVCLGYGFEPSSELLRALGCDHEFDAGTGHRRIQRDEGGRTDRAGIYAVGDCTDIGGARAALAEGTVAGFAAATDLGHALDPGQSRDLQRARRSIARHRRFQRALWRLYSAPRLGAPPTDRTALACRCEEVTFRSLCDAIDDGIQTIGALKRRTRAGMGACQGRYCGPMIESLLAERTGIPRDEHSCFAPRAPVKPIRIADLAGLIDD